MLNMDWNNQPQRAVINDIEYHFRSKLEYRYALLLELEKQNGASDKRNQVTSWLYEDKATCYFVFHEIRGATVYTADFAVWYADGHKEIHEVKGFLTGRDVTKFRRMQKHYPAENLVLVMMAKDNKRVNRYRAALKYIDRIRYVASDFRKAGIE